LVAFSALEEFNSSCKAKQTMGSNASDRRQFGRRPSRADAYMVVDGRPPSPCILLNFSEHGALLRFEDSVLPPANFRLVIADQRIDVACRVRHRTQEGIGVQFTGGNIAHLLSVLGMSAPSEAPAAVPTRAPSAQPNRASGTDLRASLIKGADQEVRPFSNAPGRVIRGI